MTLMCTELKRPIRADEHFYALTANDDPLIYALSAEALQRIPNGLLVSQAACPDDYGFFVCQAEAGENQHGNRTLEGFSKGNRLFGMTAATVRTYLPQLALVSGVAD